MTKPISIQIYFLVGMLFLQLGHANDLNDHRSQEVAIHLPEWTEDEISAKPIEYLEKIQFANLDLADLPRKNVRTMMVIVMQFYGIADPARERANIPIKSDCDLISILAKTRSEISAVIDSNEKVTNFVKVAETVEKLLTSPPE